MDLMLRGGETHIMTLLAKKKKFEDLKRYQNDELCSNTGEKQQVFA